MMPKTKEEVKSILVVRSAPLPRTFEILKKMREEYPNAEISILVQQEVKDEIEKTGLVNKVIVGINPVRCLLSNGVKGGRISFFRPIPLILQLRKKAAILGEKIKDILLIVLFGSI